MSQAGQSRWRRLLDNLLLAGAVVLVMLAVGEMAARWARARRGGGREDNALARYSEFDARLGWRKKPGAHATYRRREYTVDVDINGQGLRDPERAYAAAPGTFRILALGDSFVEGYTVPLDQTVTQRMERALARPGCPVEVLNGGTSGYSTDQEYLFYQQEGARYSPAVVLLFFYYNDVVLNTTDSYYGRLKPLLEMNGDWVLSQNLPLPEPTPRPAEQAPARRPPRGSALVGWVKERLQRGAPKAYNRLARAGLWDPLVPEEPGEEMRVYKTGPTPRIDGAWQLTCGIIGALRYEVETRGARLLVVHVPNKMEVSDRDRELTRLAYGMDDAGWDAARVLQRLRECARREGLEVLDLVPALRAAGPDPGDAYFTFDPHWNALGHQAAAEAVAADLRARGWLPACATAARASAAR
jgi:lysophospholipase L1-like esterase